MIFEPVISKKFESILEIGPGGLPHRSSDVWLDYDFTEVEHQKQSGGIKPLSSKFCVYYKGGRFPFIDGAFDYVIASHVFEHVPWEELPGFISEIERVAKAGYIELPRWPYEVFFDIDEHISVGDVVDGTLILSKKNKRMSGANLRREFLKNHSPLQSFISKNRHLFFCGMEWKGRIPVKFNSEYLGDLETNDLSNQMKIDLKIPEYLFDQKLIKSYFVNFVSRIKKRLGFIAPNHNGFTKNQVRKILMAPDTLSQIDKNWEDNQKRKIFSIKDKQIRCSIKS